WEDRSMMRSWADFQLQRQSKRGFCFITGRDDGALAENHPARIRNPADRAKLVSSNDEAGYTFRGRFHCGDEAAGISDSATQKAHSELRWLIERQGYRNGSQAIVAWAISGKP